jgi:hypothetical protein
VKELETKVAALEETNKKIREENNRLKKRLEKIELENENLKGSHVTFTFPVTSPSTQLYWHIFKQFHKSGNYSPPLSDPGSFADTNNQQEQQQQQQQLTDMPMYDLEEFTVKPISPTSLSDSSTGQKSDNTPNSPAATTQQVSTKVQNIMMQYQDFTQHHPTTSPPTTVAVEGHGFLDCPKVWERIVTHPRFDEVDIEALCAELNSKVRIVSVPTCWFGVNS